MALKRAKKRTEFKELREQAGLTLSEATQLLKVDRRTSYRYERGETKPTRLALDTLRQVAQNRLSSAASAAGFRFIDLFAGIGGLRIGFESIGGRCVFTSEWDAKCQETYALNFPDKHVIAGDIREYSSNPEKIPAHEHFKDLRFELSRILSKLVEGLPDPEIAENVA
jgi:DNA (cytosine-5)-methyltransferase 1